MILDEIVRAQKGGEPRGIPSICSAHPEVLKAALRAAASFGAIPLIEATCNQVNQLGGYTGMTPQHFVESLGGLAKEAGFPVEDILLGGDHLGPGPWQDQPAEAAMQKAEELVRAYVWAGFIKLHLDCSMRLWNDPAGPLDPGLAARRAARLARAAEGCGHGPLRYVIGTEVPVPGGAQEKEAALRVTTSARALETIDLTQAAFKQQGLEAAWQRVVALVVQPGVEFGDDFIADYQPDAAGQLAHLIRDLPMVYEAHSTDYQSPWALRALVRDGFAVLKVGPALTHAYREIIFVLAQYEQEHIAPEICSSLPEVLEQVMLAQPRHWEKYYHGTPEEQAMKRRFSMSDRMRYYWPDPTVQQALGRLMSNLEGLNIPASWLGESAPNLRLFGAKEYTPAALVRAGLQSVLTNYYAACGGSGGLGE